MSTIYSIATSRNGDKIMKASRAWFILLVTLTATASWAGGDTRLSQGESPFQVQVSCEDGVGEVGVADARGDSYLSVGLIDGRGAAAETTTKLLSADTRQWIASELMASEGMIRGERAESPDGLVSSCLRDTDPGPVAAEISCVDYLHMCICLPDDESDCSAFQTICAATGGIPGHNQCHW